jgi:restriction endonuclease S subunit
MKSPWPTKKLGEIAEIYSGGRSGITKKDYVERGFPAFSASGQDGFTKEAYDSGFAVILSSIGSRCGKCFYAEGKWTALANTQIIKFENPVTAKFMYYYLNDANKWPKSGTGQPFISPSVVKNLIVPFPPLHIQQKIVQILDTIQSAVEVQERIIEKTKELKKSLMAELFKYGGPSFRKGRKLKKTETLNQSELGTGQVGEIPEDWEVVRLGKVVKLSNGIRPEFDEEGFFPVYGANGIMGRSKKFLVDNEYTLIIGRVGASGEIHLASGKIWISDNALYTSEVEKEKVYLPFLKDYLIWRNLKQFADRSTHPIITQTFLKNFKIPLPPLPEQREIAEILQTIDQKIEIEKKKKELYEELFKTMLNKIMNGEIDVEKIEI